MPQEAIGQFPIGTEAIASTVLHAPPTVVILTPSSIVTTSTLATTWTYTSVLSRAQTRFKVQIRTADGSAILFDSGEVVSAATTYASGFVLTSFTGYQLRVSAFDGLDWSDEAILQFSVELGSLADVADNDSVGSIYEVGINGVGYMLADHPELQSRYRKQTVQLDPERLVTGDTPFDESIERYSLISHDDWTAGEGQLYRDRPSSDESRYFYSEGIDPFDVGEIKCLLQSTKHVASAYGVQRAVGVGASAEVYVQTGDQQLTHRANPAGPNTAFNPGLAGNIAYLASDGDNWYATDGTTIRRNTTAADPGADWSTVAVTRIEWIGDRLAGIDGGAAIQNFTTFTSAGAEEVPSGRFPFPDASLIGITGGDGYVWFGVNRGGTGVVHAWQLDSADGAFIALTMPPAEIINELYFYQGNVFLATFSIDVLRARIYRCVPSEGRLTPEFLTEIPLDLFQRVCFAGIGKLVAFSWDAMQRTGESGIGVIDLETAGIARWYSATPTTGGSVQAVVRWSGDFGFTVSGDGFYGKTAATTYRAGFLETSAADLGTNIVKVLDSISLSTHPLTGTVAVLRSTDTNATFQDVGSMSATGSTTADFTSSLPVPSIGLRFVLTPDPTSVTPVLKRVVIKMHPFGLVDQVVTVPINCADYIDGLNQVILPGGYPGFGRFTARSLEALVGRIVQFQDVDWPITRVSETYQVVSADHSSTGVFDRHVSRRADHAVVVLTLRKPA